ncbi:Ig-like domain-containing protein, partial [Enterobacteriaceae bacterium H11S18]|uniref:Ig-like domain-containing protein n=1 Tax=Dryocola clanedunensis TaxID=2925396 RepID=UPI0022F01381
MSESTNNERDAVLAAAASNSNPSSLSVGIDYSTTIHIDSIVDDTGKYVGTVLDGGLTDDLQPTLKGYLPEGKGIEIRVFANGSVIGYTTVGEDNNWSFTPSTPLEAGRTYEFQVFMFNPGDGNTLWPSNTYTVTTTEANQDGNTAPDAPVITAGYDDVGDSQGSFSSGTTTDDTTPQLSGKAEAGSLVKIYDGSALIGSVTAGGNGEWTFTPTARSEGQHIFTATATDAAGNVSDRSGDFVVNIDIPDATPARIEHVIDDQGIQQGDIENGGITDDRQPHLTGSAAAGSTVTIHQYDPYSDKEYALGSAVASANGQWEYQLSGGQVLQYGGESRFWITTLDNTGNTATSPDFKVTLVGANQDVPADTTPPDAPVITSAYDNVGTVQGDLTSGAITDDGTPELHGKAEANSVVKIYDGSALIGSVTAGSDGLWHFTPTARSEGQHIFTATATDSAGNVSDKSGSFVLTVDYPDTTPARIEHVIDDQGIQQGDIENGGITDDRQPHLTGSAAAGSTV